MVSSDSSDSLRGDPSPSGWGRPSVSIGDVVLPCDCELGDDGLDSKRDDSEGSVLDREAIRVLPPEGGSSPVPKEHGSDGQVPYRRWTIGVDPGNSGALAAIDPIMGRLAILDMPVRTFGATANRREVNAASVAQWFNRHPPSVVYLEEVWGLKGDGGVNGFTFGDGYGVIRGVAAGLECDLVKVRATIWKARMKVNSDKDWSRERASQLFPSAAEFFQRKKDDGRAEAALIAFYGILLQDIKLEKVIEFDEANSS